MTLKMARERYKEMKYPKRMSLAHIDILDFFELIELLNREEQPCQFSKEFYLNKFDKKVSQINCITTELSISSQLRKIFTEE